MIVQSNDKLLTKAVYTLRRMSEDEQTQELARMRDKALHDEASYIASARADGKEEGIAEMVSIMRQYGIAEDAISNMLAQQRNLYSTPR